METKKEAQKNDVSPAADSAQPSDFIRTIVTEDIAAKKYDSRGAYAVPP